MLISKKRARLGLFLIKHMNIQYILAILTMLSTISSASAGNSGQVASSSPNKELVVEATAYSSTFDQTDDTPFITANGTYVHDGVVAANFLPFGTTIKIPEVYGDKVFVVKDRMHRRFQKRIDIWFPDRQSALRFGYQELKIQILEN